ncbi:MAG: hypothetical protein LUD14_07425 [Clostridiales bacterium]|nr:hypothetical protein [Clostridiales bacterium]
MGTADVQNQISVDVNPYVVVAGELEGDSVAIFILAVVGHLEVHGGDHTKTPDSAAASGITSRVFAAAATHQCIAGGSGRHSVKGQESGCVITAITVSCRKISNLHSGVGCPGAIIKVNSIFIAI